MVRNVLAVSDGGLQIGGCGADDLCWTQITWQTLSVQALEKSQAILVVVIAPAARLACAALKQWTEGGQPRRILAVLPADSAREEIEFALSLADDLILGSDRPDLLQLRARRLVDACGSEAGLAYESLIAELGRANLVGRDPNFLRAAERMTASARTDLPVLITGETGTGKELFARAVHFISPRRNHPFVPVDCGAIPDHLFENELFGHVRGAFTDAHSEQHGLASIANGGTLFLDEVDSLSASAQTKLLRFLQERRFRALGSEKWVQADVRIVAASNGDLTRQVAEKHFRQDLYFRLDVLRLELPPLRQRPQDICLLARHFLSQHQLAGARKSFSPSALRRLASYDWPGNVRELLNVIQRAIVFSKGSHIDSCDITLSQEPAQTAARKFRTAREQTVASFERAYVEELLTRNQGNITHAAREAGKERRAFGRLVKKHGIQARTAGQI
jgi:DNA-binding NtrC family response regulator